MAQGLGGEGEAALLKLWDSSESSSEPPNITEYETISLSKTVAALPQFSRSTDNLIIKIQDYLREDRELKLVILDDDPTGTQTCHDINVLTMWDVDLSEFCSESRGFFHLDE